MLDINGREIVEWLAKKIFWFILVPYFGYLSYYTQIRPYFLSKHGEYMTGFFDGITLILSFFVFGLYVIAKTGILNKYIDQIFRRRKVQEVETSSEILNENIENLTSFIDINAVWIGHDLREINPQIDIKITFYNRSICDIKLLNFSYTPILEGLSGGRLIKTDRIIDKLIPHQDNIWISESFQITEPIRKKMILWKNKSENEMNFHLDINWLLTITAKFMYKNEFTITKDVKCRKWAHSL